MEWVERALRNCGPLSSGSVSGIETEIIGQERGFTGVIARVRIAYTASQASGPASAIAKFPLAERSVASTYTQSRATTARRAAVERAAKEVAFYQFAGDRYSWIPDFYAGIVDESTSGVMLLLEDLVDTEPGDALTGCTPEEARAVLASIQEFHRDEWNQPSLGGPRWLSRWSDASGQRLRRFREHLPEVIEHHGARLTPEVIHVLQSLAVDADRIFAGLAAAPATIIHGDLHLDNVMFRRANNAILAIILDWQGPSVGPGALDVAGFIAESLSVEDRRNHEIGLLREYHDMLVAGGVAEYSFDRLVDDVLRSLCVRAIGQVGWLFRVISNAPVGREAALVDAIFDPGRVYRALLDHDAPARLAADRT